MKGWNQTLKLSLFFFFNRQSLSFLIRATKNIKYNLKVWYRNSSYTPKYDTTLFIPRLTCHKVAMKDTPNAHAHTFNSTSKATTWIIELGKDLTVTIRYGPGYRVERDIDDVFQCLLTSVSRRRSCTRCLRNAFNHLDLYYYDRTERTIFTHYVQSPLSCPEWNVPRDRHNCVMRKHGKLGNNPSGCFAFVPRKLSQLFSLRSRERTNDSFFSPHGIVNLIERVLLPASCFSVEIRILCILERWIEFLIKKDFDLRKNHRENEISWVILSRLGRDSIGTR